MEQGSIPTPMYMLQLNNHYSLSAVQREEIKEIERKHAKQVTHHVLEIPLRTQLSHCIEKIMFAHDISGETGL